MTRATNSQIWYEQAEQVTRIGFTQSFLEQLQDCWHILPASRSKIKTNTPLLAIETNDALISVLSPVTGFFTQVSHKAMNFPNQLTEEDVVMELGQQAATRPPGAPTLAGMGVTSEVGVGALRRTVPMPARPGPAPSVRPSSGGGIFGPEVMSAAAAREQQRRDVLNQIRTTQITNAAAQWAVPVFDEAPPQPDEDDEEGF